MRRTARILGWSLISLAGAAALLIAAVLIGANIEPGRRLIESLVPRLTGDTVRVTGLSGRFPDRPRLARIELRDPQGTWLTAQDAVLDWSPLDLLHGRIAVDLLAAGQMEVARPAQPPANATPPSPLFLPLPVVVHTLRIGRLTLAAPVAGTAVVLGVEGSATVTRLRDLTGIAPDDEATLRLTASIPDGTGQYVLDANIAPGANHATLTAREAPGGWLAHLAALPDLGAIDLHWSVEGPRSALATRLDLSAGQLKAEAKGSVDAEHRTADLSLSASAPAMTPAPDLSWQSITLDAHIAGPLASPTAQMTAHMAALSAGGAAIGAIDLAAEGDAGNTRLHGTVTGLRLPGPAPELFAADPVTLDAEIRLDATDRPVTFALRHPRLALAGTAHLTDAPWLQADLTLPDLAPFAAAGGIGLAGHVALALRAAQTADGLEAAAQGHVGITSGPAPVLGLIGEDAAIGAAAALHGGDIAISRLTLDGRTLRLSATGGLTGGRASADAELGISDLAVLAPQLAGNLRVKARADGPTDNLTAHADLTGTIAARGMASGPLTATLDATGLPGAPDATLKAEGSLLGAPVDVALAARLKDGVAALTIDRASWKSLHAEGTATLPEHASIPRGQIELAMTRLEDLAPLIGQKIAGSLTAALDADETRAKFEMEARNAGLTGAGGASRVTLAATVTDPAAHPVLDAMLAVDGLTASGVAGSAKMQAKGPMNALAVRVEASLPTLSGAAASLSGAAQIDAAGKAATLTAFQAGWRGETLRLLGPARINFGDGMAVDRLQLGLRQAVINLAGRVSPTLDATASVTNLPADLAAVLSPDLAADGTLRAEARLTGPTDKPSGTVTVTAAGLRLRSGPGRALPPASLDARAALAAGTARIDANATAGLTHLTLSGQAPTGAGPLNLRVNGMADLAMLDPLLAANARRVRGRLTLDATITGTSAAPRLAGTARLAGGEVQDFAQGVHLSNMTALLTAQGDSLRIDQLSAAAGPGTITAAGTIGVLAPTIPLDLRLTARNAEPLASDLLTARLNADLTLRGEATGPMAIAGTVLIERADIRIPERLPASVPVLNVRIAGAPLPPPAPPPAPIGMDVTITAPEQIFVRGRGLDAELGGRVHLGGTLANLQPSGGFNLRRGSFSLAGQTLNFSRGEVGFAGDGLTDPTIDFVATSATSTVTATLEVSGTARAPRISLSSVPELPQDEVLAQLLFGRSAKSLGPFELAQIAAALASLSGVAPSAADPLGGVRQALGLDRLGVGSTASGAPALEAGRYIARGVYLGVRQGIGAVGSQAQVQIDLLKGLKLQGTVGTGSAASAGTATLDPANDSGSSVGLTYQFEY